MSSNLFISYDLISPGQNYDAIQAAIRGLMPQRCGENIGWLGRVMELLMGSMHTRSRGYGEGAYITNYHRSRIICR